MFQRWRLILIAVVAILILLAVVYFPDTEMSVDIICDDFTEQGGNVNQEIVVSAWIDRIIVSLCSNPTTGFQWQLKDVSSKSADMIILEDNQYLSPEDSSAIGASGKEVWTFGVHRKGSANITMAYQQPDGDNSTATWTFNLAVDAH